MRQLQTRINLNYRPLSRLSMDLKVMPRSYRGHRYILCIIDEVTNYIISAPIKQSRSEEVGEALINNVFSKYCIPDYMIMDLDSVFMWSDYLSFATLAHNTYNSPNLSNYSPYELVFGRKPKLLLNLETDPDIKVSATYKEIREKIEVLTKGSSRF